MGGQERFFAGFYFLTNAFDRSQCVGKIRAAAVFLPYVFPVSFHSRARLHKLGSRYDLAKGAMKLKRAASNGAPVQNKEWGPDDKNLEMWEGEQLSSGNQTPSNVPTP